MSPNLVAGNTIGAAGRRDTRCLGGSREAVGDLLWWRSCNAMLLHCCQSYSNTYGESTATMYSCLLLCLCMF